MFAYMSSNSGSHSSYAKVPAPAVLFRLNPFHGIATNKGNEVAVIDEEEEKKPLPSFEDEEEDWSDVSV